MPNSLNIVSVRIKEKGAEIAWMISAFSGCAIVTATGCEPCTVESAHHFLAASLKREMDFADWPLRGVDEKFIRFKILSVLVCE